jgi:hypothetical protein
MNVIRSLALIFCLLLPARLVAQPVQADPDGAPKSGTYLKAGFAHWQGDLDSRGSLSDWSVDLFGVDYNLTSVNVAIDHYFGSAGGFSVGYRKDALGYLDAGHMFSASLFGSADLKVVALKIGGGLEWGMPSLNFDVTELETTRDGTVRYRHTYPERNADVPFVGTKTDGALYPFIELSAGQRSSVFLLEAGVRINIIGFHFDDYEVSARDEVRYAFARKRMLIPYLFANFGIRLS